MIIALTGKKGSGKDVVADILVKNFGFKKYGFGDPIKNVAREMFGFSEEQLYGNLKDVVDEKWGIKPRDFFQKFGTEYGQFIFPKHFPEIFSCISERQFWVKRFKIWYDIEKDCNRLLKVVINDLRFIHEYEYLLNMDAYVIKIERDGVLQDNHISENELSNNKSINYNYIIENNGSIEELEEKIINLIS